MTKTLKERNHSYLEETIALREKLEGGFLILAERLMKIRDERKYDPEYENFEEFLREMRIAPATASKLINVYEKFVIVGGISPERLVKTGWTNPSLFLKFITDKKSAREIFDKIEPLDRTDAIRTFEEMKRGIDMRDCPHDDTYQLKVCRICGEKWNTELNK